MGTVPFEGENGIRLNCGEENEDEAADAKTSCGSWLPVHTFVLAQVSEIPTAPLQKEPASIVEEGDNERGQCVCK